MGRGGWALKETSNANYTATPLFEIPSFSTRCGGCENTFYCSRECQRGDWQRHKAECKDKAKQDTLDIALLDLGKEPSQAVKDAAVKVFHEKCARGLRGKDNPCPTFFDATGKRMCL